MLDNCLLISLSSSCFKKRVTLCLGSKISLRAVAFYDFELKIINFSPSFFESKNKETEYGEALLVTSVMAPVSSGLGVVSVLGLSYALGVGSGLGLSSGLGVGNLKRIFCSEMVIPTTLKSHSARLLAFIWFLTPSNIRFRSLLSLALKVIYGPPVKVVYLKFYVIASLTT